jgi:hypothetical protein
MNSFTISKGDLITCQICKQDGRKNDGRTDGLVKIVDFEGSCGGGHHDWTLVLKCGHKIDTQDHRL